MSIGIIGAGISGLQLALFLQRFGIDNVVYADKTPEQIREGRLLNTVARFDRTRRREQALDVDHWDFDDDGWAIYCAHVVVKGEPLLYFVGDLERPASFVDFRLYLPKLMEDYADRGGAMEFARMSLEDLPRLAARHDLLVVATGVKGLTDLFPRVPERSPYSAPQRRLMAGVFNGITQPDPLGLTFAISPGAGEIFQGPFYSFVGRGSNLLLECVPGGPLEPLTQMRYDEDPVTFDRAVLAGLKEHAPTIYERVDPATFGLARPLDLLQGALTPVVRRAWAPIEDGRFCVAIGDGWITNDPLTGQGANLGSECAWRMAELIRDATLFDEQLCRRAEDVMWEYAEPVTRWTNAMLQPPPPHVVGLLIASAQSKEVADAIVEGFNQPPKQWPRFASPEGATSFLAELGVTPGDVPAVPQT